MDNRDSMDCIDNNDDEHGDITIFRHRKCTDWGHGILAWQRDTKRGVQFEDGKLRVFKEGYYHLLEEVDLPLDRTHRILARLDRALGRREAARRCGMDGAALLSIEDQIKIFALQYPAGFQGDAWTKKMRGPGTKKSLKRHRDPAIRVAAELLAEDTLAGHISEERHDLVLEATLTVLKTTSLVTPAQLRSLQALPPHRHARFAQSLQELLYGEGERRRCFEEFVRAMGDPCWELATALPALVHPDTDVCVHARRFKQQALWMAPRMEHARSPNAAAYQRYLAMACAMRDKLQKAGLEPRDLLDVLDFIHSTLTPSARKLLERVPTADAAPADAEEPEQAAA